MTKQEKKEKLPMQKALDLMEEAVKMIEDLDYGIDFSEKQLRRLRSSFYTLRKKKEEFEEWSALQAFDEYVEKHPEISSVSFHAEFSSDDQGGGDYYLYARVAIRETEDDEEEAYGDHSDMEDHLVDIMSTFDVVSLDDVCWERKNAPQFKKVVLGEERVAEYEKKLLNKMVPEQPNIVKAKRI